jgi:hypothetical protein
MKSGRSRFWVKKLEGYTRSEFKVKTKTMVAGVRGTDFVIEIDPKTGAEEAFVLQGFIDVVSLAEPGRIIQVRANQKVRVKDGQGVSPIEKMTPAEVTRLKNEVPMPFDQTVMSAQVFKTEKAADSEEEDSQQQTEETVPADQEAPEVAVKEETESTGEPGASPTAEVQPEIAERIIPKEEIQQVEETQKEEEKKTEEEVVYAGGEILYPPGELVTPDPLFEIENLIDQPLLDWLDESLTSEPGKDVDTSDLDSGANAGGGNDEGSTNVTQAVAEQAIAIGPLPGLPGTPVP